VKPPPFEYRRAGSVDEAVELLAAHGDDARVLAGGQSLMLELNYRRFAPRLLVDVNGITELEGLRSTAGALRAGALARHVCFERLTGDDPLERLLSRVARAIAHPPVRNRGTMAGSLAYAHPSAEWPALAMALDAELTLISSAGPRIVPAASFFTGAFHTSRRPDELIVDVVLPSLPPKARVGFVEHRRTQASFAVVAAVAVLELDAGTVRSARVAVAGGSDRPLRAHAAEVALLAGGSFADAAAAAAAESDPQAEPHCSAEYRRQAVEIVVRRALEQAAA
jgi:aerobic carbon-monoxide dehydrogenase medium subunit